MTAIRDVQTEVVGQDQLDVAVWRLMSTGASLRQAVEALAQGVPMPDGDVFSTEVSHETVRRRWRRMLRVEVPVEDRDALVHEQMVVLQTTQRSMLGILLAGGSTSSEKVSAARMLDRVVRTRAEMLGLNAPAKLDVSVSAERPIEEIDAEILAILGDDRVALPEGDE